MILDHLIICCEDPQKIKREIYKFMKSVTYIFDLNSLKFYYWGRSQSEETYNNS